MRKIYVHYGCGFKAPKEWTNFDVSPTLRFERIPIIGKSFLINDKFFPSNVLYGDITRGLPDIKENSCVGIFCSHVLEHMALKDARLALLNTYNLLKPNGIFRIVVPDLERIVKNYIKGITNGNFNAAYDFNVGTLFGKVERDRNFLGTFRSFFGTSSHFWMWDKLSLEHELKKAGFSKTRESFFNDSKDNMFKFVEERDRFKDAIAFECIK